MDNSRFGDEVLYQATMSIVRKMMADGLIDNEEYSHMSVMMREKYRPPTGTLFS